MTALALIPDARADLLRRFARGIRPRVPLSVTQWADAHRILGTKASGEPGRYASSRTPHLRAIMDDLSVNSACQRVVCMKPAQGGVTELALNWLGYIMSEVPAPVLVVLPTLEVRKRWVRQRLEPMLQDCPTLAALLDARRTRDSANSEDMKDYPGGLLILGGANSPASLTSMPIRFVVCDELDRFPWEVGNEGDPLGLIDERTKAFSRRKVFLISTPTVDGQSRIQQEYLASDQRELQLPCPHCGDYLALTWTRADGALALEESKTTGRVWYICPHCGAGIEEYHKQDMLAHHRWVAKFPGRAVHGYHWTGLSAPLGLGFTWREMLDQYHAAKNDSAKLKRFTNTSLGDPWKEKGDDLEDVALFSRRETYPETLPEHALVGGTDVQKDRLETTVLAVGAGDECWVVDHIILPGDTTQQDVWDDLEALHDDAGVQIACIDAGYNTQMVNDFVASHGWCVAVKGVSGMNRPIVEDQLKRRQRLRRRVRRGVPQEPIGVDTAKATLYGRLRNAPPGPGTIHFPAIPSIDEEYFAQLAAERLVTKARRGRIHQEWTKTRPRNEALDCLIYAWAAWLLRDLVGLRRPPVRPTIGDVVARLGALVADAKSSGPATPAPPPSFSGFGGGRSLL